MDYNPLFWILMECVFTKIIDYNKNVIEFKVLICNNNGL